MLRLKVLFLLIVCGSLVIYSHVQQRSAGLKSAAAVAEELNPISQAFASMPSKEKVLAFLIDGEAGDEPFEGKKGVAFVATGRAHDNKPYWGGKDLRSVVCKHDKDKKGRVRWQFDGAKHSCLHNFAGKPSAGAMDIAGKVLSGEYVPTAEEARWRYFFNQYESGFNGAVSLLCETKIGRTIGGHIFAEPKSVSKTCLWQRKHHKHHLRTRKVLVASASKIRRAVHKNKSKEKSMHKRLAANVVR